MTFVRYLRHFNRSRLSRVLRERHAINLVEVAINNCIVSLIYKHHIINEI